MPRGERDDVEISKFYRLGFRVIIFIVVSLISQLKVGVSWLYKLSDLIPNVEKL
ncbi:hypothetical protein LguiA_002509 [Lonicera macranthoides]